MGSLIGILSLGLPAEAGERGWYAAVEAGANWVGVSGNAISGPLCGILALTPCPAVGDATSDPGLAVFASLGTSLAGQFRVEGELGFRMAEFDGSSDITNTTVMLNGLFDIPVTDSLSFMVGAGVGVDWVDVSASAFTQHGDGLELAYQGIVGISCDIGGADLTVKYRYMTADIADHVIVSGPYAILSDDMDTSTVTVGLSFDL